MEKTKNKQRKLDIADKILLGLGGSALGLAAIRGANHLVKDPTTIDIYGGTTTHADSNVFSTQRDALRQKLQNVDANVNTHSNYNSRYLADFSLLSKEYEGKKKAAPIKIHVGSSPRSDASLKLRQLLTGDVYYRQLSDFGDGNFDQPDVKFNGKNWMKAQKNNTYDRNIVPGGDVFAKINNPVPTAKHSNIDVASIPITGSEVSNVAPNNMKKKVLVMGGSGIGWGEYIPFPAEKNLGNLYEGFEKAYGKGNFEFNVLGGPNISDYHRSHFESAAKTYGFNYIPKVDGSAKVRELMLTSDMLVTAPGSSIADYASIKGHKPKMLALVPNTGGHYDSNVKWLRNTFGGVDSLGVRMPGGSQEGHELGNSDIIANKVRNLINGKAPNEHSVLFSKEDGHKIMNAAKEDYKISKGVTRNIALGGVGVLGAIAIKKLIESKGSKNAKSTRNK